MSDTTQNNSTLFIKFIAVAAAVGFLYATVLAKLGLDWWTDENYSHGLLVPVVIAIIIWKERDAFHRVEIRSSILLGGITIFVAVLLLIAGTLGAELFTQRMSLVIMLGGIVIYFFGARMLNFLVVPFALLLLAIPIPQIIFNRIAFPLQIWASKMAVWGIRVFEVPTLRKGNVIDILPSGATQTISLEVVEACSGIRSLMTLVTLALILGFFTGDDGEKKFANLSSRNLIRAVLLMISAVPIAVLTNAARVSATGVLTYYYGKQATEGTWHDLSGWLVFVVALAMLIGVNFLFKKFQRKDAKTQRREAIQNPKSQIRNRAGWPLVIALIVAGLAVNWFANRAEVAVERRQLTELSTTLGDWRQRGSEIKFGEGVENVLKTTDYTMREYTNSEGRVANIYVGYYATQRMGATYHSPQNCLPGAGWIMNDPQFVEITTTDGRTFTANRYIIENGIYKEVMIYWYQGRGRIEASEYRDKINTVLDSVTRRRTDAAMVRVMTSVGDDEAASLEAASSLAARLAEQLTPFVPE